MQAYIANLAENFEKNKIVDSSYQIYFSGCDFNCKHCNVRCFSEFRDEYTLLLKDLKYEIRASLDNIKSVTMTGGEPCLQRQAMLDLAKFAKKNGLRVIIKTHGTKPETLISLLKENLVDEIKFYFQSTLEFEHFQRVTRSSTFFKPSSEIITDLNHSLRILKDYEEDIDIHFFITVVPGIFYKKEDILSVCNIISGIRSILTLSSFAPEENSKLSAIIPPSEAFMKKISESIYYEFPDMIVRIN